MRSVVDPEGCAEGAQNPAGKQQSFNDLIGTIAWALPLLDQVDVPKAAGDARYRISLATLPR